MSKDQYQSKLIALAITAVLTLGLFFIIKPERRQSINQTQEQKQSRLQLFNPDLNNRLKEQSERFDLDDPTIMLNDSPHSYQVSDELEITLPVPKIKVKSDSLKAFKAPSSRAQTFTPKLSQIDSVITEQWPQVKIAEPKTIKFEEKVKQTYFISSTENPFPALKLNEQELKLIKEAGEQKHFIFFINYNNGSFSINSQTTSSNLKIATLILHKKLLQEAKKIKIVGKNIPYHNFTLELELI